MAEEKDIPEDDFDDSAEYSPKSEFSKPKLLEEATRRCFELRSKEMRKGYYNTTVTKEGLPIRTWIEDTRKCYVSAVTAIRKLLTPEILEDKKYKDKKEDEHPLKMIDKKIKELKEEYCYSFLEEYRENGKRKFKKTKRTFMPEIDSPVMVRKVFPDGNESLVEVAGYWNQYINSYWDNMVDINDEIFEQIMRVIHRKNYFKTSQSYG